jgi:hypothetical protein
MRILMIATVTAATLALAACGGKGDDKLGDQVEQAAENKADAMEAAADNMGGAAEDSMEARADAVRDAGDAKQERIDDADVNADAMTPAQKKDVVTP